jgi:hypothetical protein
MATSEQASMRIADRVKSKNVEFGFELTPFILPLISRLFGCLTDNDDVSAKTAQDRIVELNEKDPARLLRRTTKAVLRHARKEGKRITDEQAKAIAQATIDEACECDHDECCAVFVSMIGDIS